MGEMGSGKNVRPRGEGGKREGKEASVRESKEACSRPGNHVRHQKQLNDSKEGSSKGTRVYRESGAMLPEPSQEKKSKSACVAGEEGGGGRETGVQKEEALLLPKTREDRGAESGKGDPVRHCYEESSKERKKDAARS